MSLPNQHYHSCVASRSSLSRFLDRLHTALGATITTTSKANLIIGLLSILVSFTGSHLWDSIAFVSYVTRSSNRPASALHHQQQILARNITSPGAFLLAVTKLAWSWRSQRQWSSLVSLAVMAIICSVGFLIAGIFVSQLVSTSNIRVLAHSKSCGWLSWRNETTSLHREYQQSAFAQALSYSRTYYNKTTHLPQCNIYVQQAVPMRNSTYTTCPFRQACTSHPALRLDTGLLDSNDVFGINTGKKHRVQIRRVITCSPLDQSRYLAQRSMPSGYTQRYEGREVFPGELLYEWFLGSLSMSRRPFESSFWQSNYTSKISKIFDLTPRAYFVPVNDSVAESRHRSTFMPIAELRHEDSDTHIIAIQNNGVRKIYVIFDNNDNTTMYTGDNLATVLGCAEQTGFCFASGVCTPLLGVDAAYQQALKIAPTSRQKSILTYSFFLIPTMYDVTRAPMLVTQNAASFQSGVPSNQWEIETIAWNYYLLALMQTTISHLAAGPGIARPDYDQLVEKLAWPDLCHSQRMGGPDGFSNINVVGLILVFTVSGMIISINLILIPTSRYLDKRNLLSTTAMKLWNQDGLLQIQRMVYESFGFSGWTLSNVDVPILTNISQIPNLKTLKSVRSIKTESRQDQDCEQSKRIFPPTAPLELLLPRLPHVTLPRSIQRISAEIQVPHQTSLVSSVRPSSAPY